MTRGVAGHHDEVLTLRLYVAGDAPNSCEARENLRIMLEECAPEEYHLEEVDFLREPLRAMRDGVLVTPTLVKVAPAPAQQIIGTLRESVRVRAVLGLVRGGHA